MTGAPDPATPRRRTPLEVAEDDLLEADDRVTDQEERVRILKTQIETAKNRRDELRRMRDYRAGHPLLDDTRNERVMALQIDAGYRIPDLPPVDGAFTAASSDLITPVVDAGPEIINDPEPGIPPKRTHPQDDGLPSMLDERG